MTSVRDLSEAQAFERRRLVAALVFARSGDAAERVRPARSIAGTVMAGVLLLLAAVVSGLATGRHPLGYHAAAQPRGGLATTTVAAAAP